MKRGKSTRSAASDTPAELLVDRLALGVRAAQHAPPPGARNQRALTGIARDGRFTVPPEVAIQTGIDALRESGRVYSYGAAVVMETTATAGEPELVPLRAETRVESAAGGLLANLMICEAPCKEGSEWFAPPPPYLQVLLNAEPLVRQLPRIELYARRPLFGPDFELLNPGYHPGPRYLIHGTPIDPDLEPLPVAAAARERLPRHLRTLLGQFCFRDGADLTNALALLLTGLLVNHFAQGGKPVALVDGNQPGVGKTLLMRVVGLVADGADPRLIHYTPDDEELQKRICATLRPNRQSVVLIDNAKSPTDTPISSPAVEANSMAPEISLRILGVSQNYARPNDVLWALTMNQTRVSPDLVSRGLPIRLEYAGDPRTRKFDRTDPIAYAREHRTELLEELAGFVVRWSRLGQPKGDQKHRLHFWAEVLGGILTANGFPEFLGNYDEAANAFDADLEKLTALAEAVLADPAGPHRSATEVPGAPDRAAPATTWSRFLDQVGALGEAHARGGAPRAKGIAAGKYLSAQVDRTVDVAVGERPGRAVLRVAAGRSREKKYWFDVTWDEPVPANPAAGADNPGPLVHVPVERPQPEHTAPNPTPDVPPPAGGNAEAWE